MPGKRAFVSIKRNVNKQKRMIFCNLHVYVKIVFSKFFASEMVRQWLRLAYTLGLRVRYSSVNTQYF